MCFVHYLFTVASVYCNTFTKTLQVLPPMKLLHPIPVSQQLLTGELSSIASRSSWSFWSTKIDQMEWSIRFKSGELGGHASLPQNPGNSSLHVATVERTACAGAQSC